MPDPFTPGAAADYPVTPTLDVTLPSGFKARVKHPNFYILGRTGQVPAKVIAAEKRTTASKTAAAKKKAQVANGTPAPKPSPVASGAEVVERSEDIEAMVNWVLTKVFIEPRVSAARSEGFVCVEDISSNDKSFVLEILEIEL